MWPLIKWFRKKPTTENPMNNDEFLSIDNFEVGGQCPFGLPPSEEICRTSVGYGTILFTQYFDYPYDAECKALDKLVLFQSVVRFATDEFPIVAFYFETGLVIQSPLPGLSQDKIRQSLDEVETPYFMFSIVDRKTNIIKKIRILPIHKEVINEIFRNTKTGNAFPLHKRQEKHTEYPASIIMTAGKTWQFSPVDDDFIEISHATAMSYFHP